MSTPNRLYLGGQRAPSDARLKEPVQADRSYDDDDLRRYIV